MEMVQGATIRPIAMTIADASFRRSVLALRWLLVLAYVLFAQIGILDVSRTALLATATILFAYNVAHTILEAQYAEHTERLYPLTRLLDVVSISVAMVSLHDVGNAVWAVYFINIVSVAHMLSARQMVIHVAWVAVNYVGFAFTTAALGHDVSWPYVVTVTVLLGFMGFNVSILAGGEQRLRDLIATMAVTDSLTGLPNRRKFHQAYPESLKEAIAKKVPLALMLIDVDHFKEINDRDGHPAGDDKLRDVAQALQGVMRRQDLVARYGGDEFIVVAPLTVRDEARMLAERLRQAAVACGASVSIGLAMFPDDARVDNALIEAADAALYRAKQAGRNCVRSAA